MTSKSARVIYDSAARVATPTPFTLNTSRSSGVIITINVTADPAAASVVVTLNGIDPVSGSNYNILTSAAIAATGITTLRIQPGLTVVANTHASDLTPEELLVTATHTDGDSITYSISATLIED